MAITTDQTEARRFTKKPITIEAIQWTGKNLHEVLTFIYGHTDMSAQYDGTTWETYIDMVEHLGGLPIYTLEDGPDMCAKHFADIGDWIIRGVKGEHYPCKPDIFEATYEHTTHDQNYATGMPIESVPEDTNRYFFDAGWKACANFCDRDDVRFDGIVGHHGCPQFEDAFRAAAQARGNHDR